ncbi:pre-mRNA splicing factor putative [Scheffersomyces amazonensis]|uniref:pre-mRNA splicing factor putative n=1 Tax=Scheffersomyces amazonensis TaxID=1078765 RepID=UPI00315DAA04
MSSRADYLSKYLSSGNDKVSKKKSKKHKKVDTSTTNNIVVVNGSNWTKETEQSNEQHINVIEEDPLNEELPIKVESKSTKQFKGFKRIDNGHVVTSESSIAVINKDIVKDVIEDNPKLQQPQTIYRDSRGRIIDINAKKEELEERRRLNEEKRKFDEIRTTDEDRRKQETELKKSRSIITDKFEDPLASFQEPEKVESNSSNASYSQYIYTKGLIPPNRFNVQPGILWDGIDRSNGFEELALRKQNENKFKKLESKINESYGDLDYD